MGNLIKPMRILHLCEGTDFYISGYSSAEFDRDVLLSIDHALANLIAIWVSR